MDYPFNNPQLSFDLPLCSDGAGLTSEHSFFRFSYTVFNVPISIILCVLYIYTDAANTSLLARLSSFKKI
jgi:hypothetical protein